MTDDEYFNEAMRNPMDVAGVQRLVYNYARDKTWRRLYRAVNQGVINAHQAEILMGMWYEDSPPDEIPDDLPLPPPGPYESQQPTNPKENE